MNTKSINSCTFCAKNTYLIQAEKAVTKHDKNKFLSYHYEAKARLHNLNYLKEKEKFSQNPKIGGAAGLLDRAKSLAKMVYEKAAHINSAAESYKTCPERFVA